MNSPKVTILAYGNSLDAFVPEVWANESIAILLENMVAAGLVHRDFEDAIAKFGDVVNTRKPGEFTARRKTVSDSVTVQDSTATNIPVTLNQHIHVSFKLYDGEESLSFKDLVETYLNPALAAQAQFLDKVVLGQYGQFMANAKGQLMTLSESNVKTRILETRNTLNVNKAYMSGRNFIWTPNSETVALKLDLFLGADTSGDGGQALREAALGRKLGFDHYMCQNMGSVMNSNCDRVIGAVNDATPPVVGDTVVTVDGFSAAIAANSWVSIAGDPHRVVSTVGGATPTSITIASGLRNNLADDDVVTVIDPGAVNLVGGYAAGWSKPIAVDGFTNMPVAGQLVTFGTSTSSAIYAIVDATATTITLDRPLEAAIADDAAVNPAPPGEYNFAFHRNAIALVVRPLALPRQGTGALAAVVNSHGLSIRVVITYDGASQGHLVTVDMLCGIKVLDTDLAAVMLG